MISALVTGVRLRQNAQAPELMRIAKLEQSPDWSDPDQCNALARALSEQPHAFRLVFDEVIGKDGPFSLDDERSIHINLSAAGEGAVRLFPKTRTQSDGKKTGSGTFRQFRMRKNLSRESGVPTLSSFPF